MVISLHYFHGSYGGALTNIETVSFNYYYTQIVETFCIISVNIFVIISGYFMISHENGINVRKVIEIYLVLVFYSAMGFIVSQCVDLNNYSLKEAIHLILFPFSKGRAWFIEIYIILFLFSPFLNKLLVSLSQKNYIILIVIQLLLFSIWPSFFSNPPISDRGYGIVHFIMLYMIAGYLKLFKGNIVVDNSLFKRIRVFAYLGGWMLCFIASCCLRRFGRAWDYNYIFNIGGALFLFLAFLNIKMRNNSVINRIGSTSLGVYIIHTDRFISAILWKNILKCDLYYSSKFYFLHMLISVFCIFIVASFLDLIRAKIWKSTFGKILKKYKVFNFIIEV